MIAPLQPDDPRAMGPYRLSAQLGSGAMGRVFLGHSADGQPVAVKVIRAELATDREFRTQFRQEVAAAQKVSGPFTALVADADPDAPEPWLATEYVDGPSLAEAVDSNGPLLINKVLWLAAGLAESLIAIHAAGVVHRDIKPSNVVLTDDGPRLIDFGISWAAWASAKPGWSFGSPAFMSPEHALGHALGPPSDIFGLGAVLTFAATGQGPFGAGSSAALIYRLVNSPARLDPLPAELRGLIGSCLAKSPDDRPTADRLLTQVKAIGEQPDQPPAASIADRNGVERPAPAGVSAVRSRPGRPGRDPRHRFSPKLPLFVAGSLAALAAAIYTMSGGFASSPAALTEPQTGTTTTAPAAQAQPQAGAATTLGPASHATVTPARSPSRRQDPIAPSAFLVPTAIASALTVPSPSGSVAPGDSPSPATSSSGSPSPSKSPSKSPSPSKSASKSPSPSPSTSPSSSPSPSPSPSSSSSSPSPSSSSSSPSPTSTTSTSPSPTPA